MGFQHTLLELCIELELCTELKSGVRTASDVRLPGVLWLALWHCRTSSRSVNCTYMS